MPAFDPQTLPWVDRDDFDAEAARRRDAGTLGDEDAARLERWRRDGYLALRGAVPEALVDDLLAAYEAGWEDRPPVKLLVEGQGPTDWAELPPREAIEHHHYRVLDFHEVSEEARRIMFHPAVTGALELIFGEPPVAMQSLFFEYGSEQRPHQDFPYVQAHVLSHLVGCWVACDDVGPDNGPLVYYPGSHRLDKYDWGGGALAWNGKDHAEVERFEKQILADCAAAGLEAETLDARKGDVFLWHAALVHGGSAVVDRSLTRKSLVIHYSTRSGYPRDRRWPEVEPVVERIGGGYRYREPERTAPGLLSRVRRRAGALIRRLRGWRAATAGRERPDR